MAELADASDSKSDGRKGRVGSIPTGGTTTPEECSSGDFFILL